MMRARVAALLSITVLCMMGVVAVGLPGSAQSIGPVGSSLAPFSVTIAPVEHELKAGSAVNIGVTVTNTSHQALLFDDTHAVSVWVYKVTVFDEDGNAPPDTKLGRMLRYWFENSPNLGPGTILGGNGDSADLAPGKSFTKAFDLASLVDLSRPGSYTIQVSKAAQGDTESVMSNLLTLGIPPSLSTPRRTAATSPGISVSISRLLNQGKIGGPLGAVVVTTNTSDQPVVIQMDEASKDQVGSTYKIKAHDEAGVSPAESSYGVAVGNANYTVPFAATPHPPGSYLRLLPGESWMDTVDLNKVYDLTRPGEYSFQVQRWDPQSKTWVMSDTVKTAIAR